MNPDHSRSFLRLFRRNHGNGNGKAKANSLVFFLCFFVSLSTAQSQTNTASPSAFGDFFSPRMAVIMVVLVTAFFFIGFFYVFIRRRAERRTRDLNGDGNVIFERQRALDASVIKSFPTFLYSRVKGLKIGKGTLECAVCLNEFEDEETLRLIPKCSHVFHTDCIDTWFSSHSTCPVCRAHLAPKPGETITCATVQVHDSETEPENRPDNNNTSDEISPIEVVNQTKDTESPDVNLINSNTTNNRNRPPRSRSTGWRLTGLFPQSHSTGQSLVQPGENCERFTLRLPEDVRSQLMNSSLSRTKSFTAFPRVKSSRRGFRSRSLGRNHLNYGRFDRSGRWGFTMTPPLFSRNGSVRSPKSVGDEGLATPPKGLSKSIKSQFDRLFSGREENIGERSSDSLRPESQV